MVPPPGRRAAPTLADTFNAYDAILGPVGPTLLPEGARRALDDAARRLPAALTRWVYLEFRLTPAEPAVDLVAYIDRAGAALVAGRAPGEAADAFTTQVRADPAWAPAAAVCAAWLDGRLPASVDHLWLEFDLGHGGGTRPPETRALPAPGVFVCFGEAPAAAYDARARAGELCAALAALDEEVARETGALVGHLVATAPRGAYVPYVGLMCQRRGAAAQAARVCLTRTADTEVLAWLRAGGWPAAPADVDALGRALHEAAAALGRSRPGRAASRATMVHADITPRGIAPRVGFEHTFDRSGQFAAGVRERALLDAFARRGWADPARCDAVAGIPRAARGLLPDARVPVPVLRFVNHTKLVFSPSTGPNVKAYAVCTHGAAVAPRRPGLRPTPSPPLPCA